MKGSTAQLVSFVLLLAADNACSLVASGPRRSKRLFDNQPIAWLILPYAIEALRQIAGGIIKIQFGRLQYVSRQGLPVYDVRRGFKDASPSWSANNVQLNSPVECSDDGPKLNRMIVREAVEFGEEDGIAAEAIKRPIGTGFDVYRKRDTGDEVGGCVGGREGPYPAAA